LKVRRKIVILDLTCPQRKGIAVFAIPISKG